MPLIIAGERSGAGKTTITLALLAALKYRGLPVQSFKVGPDYIDPMFHHYVTKRPCYNLDPILTSEEYVRKCFYQHIQDVEFALIEGVMGLFDGVNCPDYPIKGIPDFASTAHIARLLEVPVLLVIDCSRLSGSVAAIAQGYRCLDPRIKLAGVVLNRVGSERHLALLKSALATLDLPVLGVLHRHQEISLPDRHLGLVPTEELPNLDLIIEKLGLLANQCFDWEQLLPLLGINKTVAKMPKTPIISLDNGEAKIKIAIARDKAFNFYYQENLDILESLGAELVFWSPLKEALPSQVQGLYFGGGFPEVFAEELSDNKVALRGVREAILAGMPVYAECGGLMYLCEEIVDFQDYSWEMVGAISVKVAMSKRLFLGYRRCVALADGPVMGAGGVVWGHEFHRSFLMGGSPVPLFRVWGVSDNCLNAGDLEGCRVAEVHASYVHLHWGNCPELPARFLRFCGAFGGFLGL